MNETKNEEKLHQKAKEIIKQTVKKVIGNGKIKNLDGETISIDIFDSELLKREVKQILTSPDERNFKVAQSEETTRVFKFIQEHFDNLYEAVYIELLREEKLYQFIKNKLKSEIEEIIRNGGIKKRLREIIPIDISNTQSLKKAVKYNIIDLGEENYRVVKNKKTITEIEFIREYFDILYDDACTELLNKGEKNKTLPVNEEADKSYQIESDILESSKKLTDLIRSVQQNMREDTENTGKTIEALKAFRKANGEKDESKERGTDISKAKSVSSENSKKEIKCIDIRNRTIYGR